MHADELRDALASHVAAGAVPGAILGVDHGGAVSLAAVGTTEPGGGGDELRPDALVRASSNTKPLVAALALALVEDGTLALDEPVERHVPELADRRVLVNAEDPPDGETVAATRPIALDDLLTMRMGMGWVWGRPCPTADAAQAAGLLGPPDPAGLPDADTWIARLAALPLLHQPGTAWRYDVGFGVLGVLLARAAQRPLPELLAERILRPAGLADTGFRAVDPARLVPQWRGGEGDDGGLELLDAGGADGAWARDPAFHDARGGLVSSATDLLAFARTLLDGTLLPARAVAAMTGDWLTEPQRADPIAAPFLDGGGWGLGLGVQSTTPAGPRYGWAGGLGTLWWSWPEHDAAAVLVTQVTPPAGTVFEAFREATEAALGG